MSFFGGQTQLTREDLGKSNISGVEVVGTRETRIIMAGVIGNDRPISITKEFWYSPQLALNMSVKRNDPRHGTQTFMVTEVSLSEPDPKVFQVPAGYMVVDIRPNAPKHPAAQGSGSLTYSSSRRPVHGKETDRGVQSPRNSSFRS